MRRCYSLPWVLVFYYFMIRVNNRGRIANELPGGGGILEGSGWGGESMPEMLGRRRGAAIGDSPAALQISALVAAPVASQESLPLPTRIRQPKRFKTY